MASPIPFVVYSDGPSLPSGLARIARDLCQRLAAEAGTLGIDLLQVGWNPRPMRLPGWAVANLSQLHADGDWGAAEVRDLWPIYYGNDQGILLTIWDPSRTYNLLPLQHAERHLWGYFPLDGVNSKGSIGGPAREAVQRADRALAYGRWGSQVIKEIRGAGAAYLPHGIDLDVWRLGHHTEVLGAAEAVLQPREGHWVLGCVATNQPRKDLGLYFATLAELRRRGEKVTGWLHTDLLVRAWAIGQLAEDFGLQRYVKVSTDLEDQVLAACYSLCGVTFAPGLGEGFGYPIVESLACGTPVVHVDYAGGREWVPMNAWRIPATAWRLEGCYAIARPVIDPVDAASAVQRAVQWKRAEEVVVQQYCRGSVSHLGWERVWPRWRSWVKQGLEGYRG